MAENQAESDASDAEFWRLRERHQGGDHSECPPAYCLHVRGGYDLDSPYGTRIVIPPAGGGA